MPSANAGEDGRDAASGWERDSLSFYVKAQIKSYSKCKKI
jgi:hypothetical protein